MCGIIAIRGNNAIKRCVDGLKKLEYRGYDSCGVAYRNNTNIKVCKSLGYVSKLEESMPIPAYDGVAIGHTRWATHGGVTLENTHPHLSNSGRFAIVHNGIIENFEELKCRYLSNVVCVGQTDSEIIAHLIDVFDEGDTLIAFKKVIDLLQGSFAIVMIENTSNSIYFARNKSPLYLCKSGQDYVLCSDVVCVNSEYKIFALQDNYYGIVDNKIYVYDKYSKQINIQYSLLSSDDMEEVSECEHYMIKEIREIPFALRRSFEFLKAGDVELPLKVSRVLIVGCGTSYHSGLIGSKYIEEIAGIKCECVIASEFMYNTYLVEENTLAIFVSQSGETADTISALNRAKEYGMFTLVITNVELSSMTRLADSVLLMRAGKEVCVASTKAFTTQVFYFLVLSNLLKNIKEGNCRIIANDRCVVSGVGKINYTGIEFDELERLFALSISDFEGLADEVADSLYNLRDIHIIGKGYDYLLALEGALKIKEVSYIFTSAYPSGELKHGTLSLIECGSVVLSINTQKALLEKGKNAIQEIISRGGSVIVFSQFEKEYFSSCRVIGLPKFSERLMPIVAITFIDLIAYFVSIKRGINPDRPRNLAKSVTVE
ncbi:MAG: glutamine--fructose-6-phosphate transaminase (isomerizing) [Clostridia bacterium]|nr:glutamine--fructose-6-phosphate transaminase (isomerizing) [Clostridia bacterium]